MGGMIWYIFPEVDPIISWEGHLAGFLTGFVFSIVYKTPNYVDSIKYEWQKPDFNPNEDAFMKHFDENGNFVPPSKIEEEVVENTEPEIKYVYVFKEKDSQSE
jgi:hypothetical protein